LSDWNGEAVRAFGVSQTLDGLTGTPVRSCFLVDADSTLRRAWRYADDELPDADELLAAARALGAAA
jgi:peroxiredoxin